VAWPIANAEMQILRGDCGVSGELSERVVECKLSGKGSLPRLYCERGGTLLVVKARSRQTVGGVLRGSDLKQSSKLPMV
jgi:hypothetical protein